MESAEAATATAGTVSDDVNPLVQSWNPDGIDFSIIPPDDEPDPKPEASRGSHRKDAQEDRARSGPPTLDEWEGFLSRFVIRALTEWYLSYAFKDVDENALSQRDIDRLRLTPEERKRIVIPLAELSNKLPIMRKHGRLIVSSGESIDSVLTLGIWFQRVNKIAAKHAPVRPVKVRKEGNSNVSAGQSASNGHSEFIAGIPFNIDRDGFN